MIGKQFCAFLTRARFCAARNLSSRIAFRGLAFVEKMLNVPSCPSWECQAMAVRSRASRLAHVLERMGLAMAGASGGLFVAVRTASADIAVLALPATIFAMMVYGAIGFYLGIDLPPEASYVAQSDAGLYESEPRTKWVERLSAAGTFLATLAAFISVYNIVLDNDSNAASALAVGCVWLVGVTMQILAGAIARARA
jgi:hypothetical protein